MARVWGVLLGRLLCSYITQRDGAFRCTELSLTAKEKRLCSVTPVNPIFSSTYLRFQARLGRFSPGTDGKVCPPGEFLRSPQSSLWHPPGIQKWRMWTDPCLHVAPEAAHLKGIRGNITQTAWSLAGTERGRWFEPSWGRLQGNTVRGCHVSLSCVLWILIWNAR